jgi:hypothetical protein
MDTINASLSWCGYSQVAFALTLWDDDRQVEILA